MRHRNNHTIASCIMIMLASGICGLAQSSMEPVYVNFIVDMDLPPQATLDQVETGKSDLYNIFNEMNSQKMRWNLFLTKEAADKARLLLAQIVLGNQATGTVEMGISGNHSYEKLSTQSYSEQQSILKDTKAYVEYTKICGINEVHAMGFLPQSFDQNEDTYKVLDDLGMKYDAGFQAGILYAPGHETDVWPYKVTNHKFYAVPVSSHMFSGELMPLNDRYAKDNGVSSSQWKDMLIGKFNEISGKDEPMVISLSTSISGSGEYLDALKQFIAFAASNDAEFVSSSDLVNMSITGVHDFSGATSAENAQTAENASFVCTTCDSTTNANLSEAISNEPVNL